MDEHRQGVATNGARAESRSEQGWGKDPVSSVFDQDDEIAADRQIQAFVGFLCIVLVLVGMGVLWLLKQGGIL